MGRITCPLMLPAASARSGPVIGYGCQHQLRHRPTAGGILRADHSSCQRATKTQPHGVGSGLAVTDAWLPYVFGVDVVTLGKLTLGLCLCLKDLRQIPP